MFHVKRGLVFFRCASGLGSHGVFLMNGGVKDKRIANTGASNKAVSNKAVSNFGNKSSVIMSKKVIAVSCCKCRCCERRYRV
jgi:mannitol-specific phosphotransferase system IIBC component